MHSVTVYDAIVDLLLGRSSGLAPHRALEAPAHVWERVLAFEGVGERVSQALSSRGRWSELPPYLARVLRDSRNAALRQAVLAERGLAEIATVARSTGCRVLAIKGAARLLAGEEAGARALSDIDLLLPQADAGRLHALLQSELGYRPTGQSYAHHLPALTKSGALGIELHTRIASVELPLDERIFADTRIVAKGLGGVEIPSATNMVLHTLEHAAGTNWMVHFRLRDIFDVATLFTDEVRAEEVRAYVEASPRDKRKAFEILLSAAHEIELRVPRFVDGAWSTVRRVARTRLALAQIPRDRNTANRVFRYVSLLAEGSPRAVVRAGVGLLRRARLTALLGALVITASCSDSTGTDPIEVPAFLFVSDSLGIPGIYRFSADTIERLSDPDNIDDQPHVAANRVVFVSRRDGNPEIYISDLDFTNQQRLTTDAATDGEPALDPSGSVIAFVTRRTGTPRIWLMEASGANQRSLPTGSPSFTPEGSPAWSPVGGRLAFTSTRTGTSQVFVLDTATGQAEQISHETGGAFNPTWSADGNSIYYVSVIGVPSVKRAPLSGGNPALVASGERVLGDPSCLEEVCLVVEGADTEDGDILAVRAGRQAVRVLVRGANDRQPSIIVP